MTEAQKCQSKLDMAQRLICALGAKGEIWKQKVQQVSQDLMSVHGEVLVVCIFARYLGVFTRQYREASVLAFIDLSKAPDLLMTMSTEADMVLWSPQGLPNDRGSCEDGVIMHCSER